MRFAGQHMHGIQGHLLEIAYPRFITLDTNNLSISEPGLDELWGFSKALLVVDNMEGETSIPSI